MKISIGDLFDKVKLITTYYGANSQDKLGACS
jgi:hypothetical protein